MSARKKFRAIMAGKRLTLMPGAYDALSARIIEAEGIRDANKIISEGLTPQIIQYKTIEAYRELSKSPNTKVIVGGGKDFILNP